MEPALSHGRRRGLVGHIREEQEAPAMRALWEGGEAAVPYARTEKR